MKTRWDIRAKDAEDGPYRAFGNGIPFLRAVRLAVKYILKYDRVVIMKSKVYGGTR